MEINVESVLFSYETIKAQYETIVSNETALFGALTNICTFDWIDGNSIDFAKAIEPEKIEIDVYDAYVLDIVNLYKFIYNKYIVLGRRIKCNLDKREAILNSIDACINSVQNIINEFNNTDLYLPFSLFGRLRSAKELCEKIKRQLTQIRGYFVDLYKKINEIESEIATKIRELSDFYPKEFSYNLLNGRQSTLQSGDLLDNEFALDLDKLVLYKEAEKRANDKIYHHYNGIKNKYTSNNLNALNSHSEAFKQNYETLYAKRNDYVSILQQVPTLYGKTAIETIVTFKEEDE